MGPVICPMVPKEAGNIDGIISMFVRIGGLRVGALFGAVEKLAIDVLLGTFFADCCI